MNKKNLVQCANGHYYDADQFAECPHCGGQTAGAGDIGSEATVAFSEPAVIDNKRTEPITVKGGNRGAGRTDITGPDDMEKTVGIGNYFDVISNQKIEPVVGWLVCIKGDSMGKSYELKAGKNFIGRSALENDIVLKGDQSISREKHAIIVYDPRSKCFLAQPGTSRELFYVNDKAVLQITEIETRDVIAIGKTELVFIPFCGPDCSWDTMRGEE